MNFELTTIRFTGNGYYWCTCSYFAILSLKISDGSEDFADGPVGTVGVHVFTCWLLYLNDVLKWSLK